jgi:glutamate-ammonia-ligase adenylyltransferase
VSTEFERKHGQINCAETALLAMGSLGAGLMTSNSDLDLILIFDADLAAKSVGQKPLSCRQYFSRLTQALITALTVPMRDGTLYEVDMRLRPSGRAGPVATSLVGFQTYQLNEAWTWEHLALMRARPVAGTQLLREKIEKSRRDILSEKNNWPDILQCLTDMRKRLAVSKPQKSPWDFKNGPGGIQDIELISQAIGLYKKCYRTSIKEQIVSGVEDNHFVEEDLKYLMQSYTALTNRRILHSLMCVADERISEIGIGGKLRLEKITNLDPSEVFDEMLSGIRERCADIISNVLTRSER